MQFFNPQEHIGRHDAQVIKNIDISQSEKLKATVDNTRRYLRDEYSHEFAKSVIDQDVRKKLSKLIKDYIMRNKQLHIYGVEIDDLIKTISQEILYFGPIQKALDDYNVTNIDINSPRDVYIERNGEEEYRPDLGFNDETHLYNMICKMLVPFGKTLSANEPVIDSLFEGYRICAVLGVDKGGIATEGTCVSIRKFTEDIISPQQLQESGTISSEMNEFFRDVVSIANIIIAGATNSGKTTTLVSLPKYFDHNTRIITIEDSPEMMLKRKKSYREYRNIVSLQTKHHEKPEKRFDIARLTKVALRMRPWKIIVGEIRDSNAARQTHEAMNTGHNCYVTLHASSAKNAATRIVQLAGDGYNDEAIAAQLADTVDLIIFQQKIKKSRIITEVVELTGYEGAKKPITQTLFKFVQEGINEDGTIKGSHQWVGPISETLAAKMKDNLIEQDRIFRWTEKGG